MGGDGLDQQLGPVAEFLLIIIALLFVAAVTAYFLTKAVQRRKERAHGKLSGSRRTGHSKIFLFGGRKKRVARPAGVAVVVAQAPVGAAST